MLLLIFSLFANLLKNPLLNLLFSASNFFIACNCLSTFNSLSGYLGGSGFAVSFSFRYISFISCIFSIFILGLSEIKSIKSDKFL